NPTRGGPAMRLTQKLHSRRGASILLALLFFLVCGFVGAVVLGSAVANAEKLQGRREDQQTYYAVSSAARLLQTALDGTRCVGEEKKTVYQCGNNTHGGDPIPTFDLQSETADGSLTDLLHTAAQSVFQSQLSYTTPNAFPRVATDFTITAAEKKNMPPVQVYMTMDEHYTALFTLQTDVEDSYVMTLTCPAAVNPVEEQENLTCAHAETITGEDGKPTEVTEIYPYTVYTRTTTVTWLPGTITKGVANGEP
ncbi:MAG: hypothetical protein RR035_07555, partial [Oscillibacter sp.]